jgi:single stranded DNA-binding protein
MGHPKNRSLFCLRAQWVGRVDFNQVTILGRVDRTVEFFTSQGGVEIASFSVATSTGWKDKQTGEWRKNVQWHHVTTYQPGFVAMLRARCKKGIRVFVQGQMSYRGYRKPGETTPRVSADVKIGPGDTLIFFDSEKEGWETGTEPAETGQYVP